MKFNILHALLALANICYAKTDANGKKVEEQKIIFQVGNDKFVQHFTPGEPPSSTCINFLGYQLYNFNDLAYNMMRKDNEAAAFQNDGESGYLEFMMCRDPWQLLSNGHSCGSSNNNHKGCSMLERNPASSISNKCDASG